MLHFPGRAGEQRNCEFPKSFGGPLRLAKSFNLLDPVNREKSDDTADREKRAAIR
jgi:hypothetical protein